MSNKSCELKLIIAIFENPDPLPLQKLTLSHQSHPPQKIVKPPPLPKIVEMGLPPIWSYLLQRSQKVEMCLHVLKYIVLKKGCRNVISGY